MEKSQDWEMGGPDKDARFNDVFEAVSSTSFHSTMKGVYSICRCKYINVYMYHVHIIYIYISLHKF